MRALGGDGVKNKTPAEVRKSHFNAEAQRGDESFAEGEEKIPLRCSDFYSAPLR